MEQGDEMGKILLNIFLALLILVAVFFITAGIRALFNGVDIITQINYTFGPLGFIGRILGVK